MQQTEHRRHIPNIKIRHKVWFVNALRLGEFFFIILYEPKYMQYTRCIQVFLMTMRKWNDNKNVIYGWNIMCGECGLMLLLHWIRFAEIQCRPLIKVNIRIIGIWDYGNSKAIRILYWSIIYYGIPATVYFH